MAKKILALILAFTLCFVFVGCDNGATGGEDVEYTYTQLVNKPDDWDTNFTSYFELDAEGNPVALTGETAPEFVANKYLARGVVQKENASDVDATDDTSSGSNATSSGSNATSTGSDNKGDSTNKNDSDNKGNNKNQGTANKVEVAPTKSTKFAKDPYSDIPAGLKGTEVEFLMNRTITDDDKRIIAEFEKKTGIKVKLTYAAYGTYGETVANRVAAKNSPDIINSERIAYPSGFTKLCEPLDEEMFKLDDPFWDIEAMQGSKIGGQYYGLISTKSLYYDARIMMYNVPLLKKILGSKYSTQSPRALWKAGKWNLDALYDLSTEIKKAGYTPLTYISQYDFALASGQDLVKYDGTKFSSNLSNTTLRKGWEWFNKLRNSEGYSEVYNQNNFLAQKTLMFINTTYNCYNKNSIAGQAKFEVDAVPVPGINGVTNAPCDYRTFAIAKGAKNPAAAAYFIRYWADNANTVERQEAVNDNVWETANFVSTKLPKTFEFSSSLLYFVSDQAESSVRNELVTAKQMSTAFARIENQINNAVKRVNKTVLKVK